MSINDPFEIHYNDKRDQYFVKRGNETFYDSDFTWILFDTKEEAQEWIDNANTLLCLVIETDD